METIKILLIVRLTGVIMVNSVYIDITKVHTTNYFSVLFTFLGPTLKSNITIPANKFRPFSTTIPVSIIAPNVELRLNLPRWNTHTLSSPKQLERIGTLSNFRFDASYIYYSTVRDDCIDQLKIMMKVSHRLSRII